MTTHQRACACADPNCRIYGCKLYRFAPYTPPPPSYYSPVYYPVPRTEVFNTEQEIIDLKRRVSELEKKLEEKK